MRHRRAADGLVTGNSCSRQLADEGLRRARSTPHQSDADAWLSRSTSRTLRRGAASAAARFTDVVVLPTPPLLLTTAITTDDLSVILSRNKRTLPPRACNVSANGAVAQVSQHPRGTGSSRMPRIGRTLDTPRSRPLPTELALAGVTLRRECLPAAATMRAKLDQGLPRRSKRRQVVGAQGGMDLLGWFRGRRASGEDRRLAEWRKAWSAAAAAGDTAQLRRRCARELDAHGPHRRRCGDRAGDARRAAGSRRSSRRRFGPRDCRPLKPDIGWSGPIGVISRRRCRCRTSRPSRAAACC